MPNTARTIVLGSRSPRRLELLRLLVPAEQILVLPPTTTDEAGFEQLHDWPAIEERLLHIARAKCDDVLQQLNSPSPDPRADDIAAIITADTVIVAEDSKGRPIVLGQPPEDDSWPQTVRRWFHDYYAGKTHIAATGLCVATSSRQRAERVVKSGVTFCDDVDRWLNWYIATGEPRGKAGGYALQGAGGLFVTRVEGSQSNVVGLPLRELLELFESLSIDVR